MPGLADVAVAPGAIRYVDLSGPTAIGNQLIVRSTTQVFVERVLPREPDAQGRVGRVGRPRQRLASVLGGLRSRFPFRAATVRASRRRPPSYRRTDGSAGDRRRDRGCSPVSWRSCSVDVEAPTRRRERRGVPAQLDRADFAAPEAAVARRRVHVGDVRQLRRRPAKVDVLRSDDVAVDVVEFRRGVTCTSATASTPCPWLSSPTPPASSASTSSARSPPPICGRRSPRPAIAVTGA